jgi:hypothetical protein
MPKGMIVHTLCLEPYLPIIIHQQYDASAVWRLWQHEHLLPPRYLRRGLHSIGDPARLRRFTHKLLSGGRCAGG